MWSYVKILQESAACNFKIDDTHTHTSLPQSMKYGDFVIWCLSIPFHFILERHTADERSVLRNAPSSWTVHEEYQFCFKERTFFTGRRKDGWVDWMMEVLLHARLQRGIEKESCKFVPSPLWSNVRGILISDRKRIHYSFCIAWNVYIRKRITVQNSFYRKRCSMFAVYAITLQRFIRLIH